MLRSAAPDLEDGDPEDKFAAWFSKKRIKLMKREYFIKILHHLINDAVSEYERISTRCGTNSGIVDPFAAMHRMVYQLTMRTLSATEIALDTFAALEPKVITSDVGYYIPLGFLLKIAACKKMAVYPHRQPT